MRTLRKNAYGLVHARLCNGAEASLPWKLLRTYLESCASIVQAVVCCPLLPPLLLSPTNPSPDVVGSRNPSKSTLAQDAVPAAVLHKHHSIIRVGAGLIQFVYGSYSHLAADLIPKKAIFAMVSAGLYTMRRQTKRCCFFKMAKLWKGNWSKFIKCGMKERINNNGCR